MVAVVVVNVVAVTCCLFDEVFPFLIVVLVVVVVDVLVHGFSGFLRPLLLVIDTCAIVERPSIVGSSPRLAH